MIIRLLRTKKVIAWITKHGSDLKISKELVNSFVLEDRPFKMNLFLTHIFEDISDDTFTIDLPRSVVAACDGNPIN